jgi:cold shock protein
MSDGTVKWFDEKKGFGFISSADGPDIFVHYTNITGDGFRTLAEGDVVAFDIVKGEKGPKAENVIRKEAVAS